MGRLTNHLPCSGNPLHTRPRGHSVHDPVSEVSARTFQITQLLAKCPLPGSLNQEIVDAYAWEKSGKPGPGVAIGLGEVVSKEGLCPL